ncbi:proteasome activator pa28, REG alpha/beta subunit [Vararia minispora EC-137]|uniref:Proteasome activator pa28, REG alpha/beta subunit n=1 Tax=Vararia minispora EC-137 TaxID=1314806 RepID=A0ACB8QQK6_9AGAM|nr:proteasome activator pa28, REG alpha/beta subunit [Vararia minispora EC-137]
MTELAGLERGVAKQLETFRKKIGQEAEDVIFVVFPKKPSELEGLIHESTFESSPFHLSHAAASTDVTVYPPPELSNGDNGDDLRDPKKRKLEDSTSMDVQFANGPEVRPQRVVANKHIQVVQEIIKNQCDEMIVFLDKVKLWINMQMPNGDNFGVQIQEDVLGELHRSSSSVIAMRDWARGSNIGRAKLCSKLIKYPNIEDYTLALKEHDERELFSAKQHLYEIRSVYAVIMDLIHKNIAKLRAPKGNNSISLY